MTNSDLSAIRALVSTEDLTNYTKAKDDSSPKNNYYYMFTGGYNYDGDNQTIGEPTTSPNEGPAGEVKLSTATSTFSITVEDSTGKNFKIRD